MPRPFPEPNLTSTTSVFEYANTVTHEWLFAGFLFVCPIALFILFRKKELKVSDSLALSIFLTLILGAMLWALGLVPGRIISVLLALTALAVLYSVVDK